MDSLSTPRNYCETLPLNRVALLVWVAGDLAAIAAAFWMLASGKWGGFIGLTFGAFALTATLLVFRRLQVRVDVSGVAAKFGTHCFGVEVKPRTRIKTRGPKVTPRPAAGCATSCR